MLDPTTLSLSPQASSQPCLLHLACKMNPSALRVFFLLTHLETDFLRVTIHSFMQTRKKCESNQGRKDLPRGKWKKRGNNMYKGRE
jgi:hypothetical protein